MGDLAWYIFICVLLVLLGSVFSGLGLSIWLRRNTGLIIRTHCDKVSEKNKPAYCRLMGTGMLAIGAGMILSGLCICGRKIWNYGINSLSLQQNIIY